MHSNLPHGPALKMPVLNCNVMINVNFPHQPPIVFPTEFEEIFLLRKLLRFLIRCDKRLRKWITTRSPLARYFCDLTSMDEFSDLGIHEEMLADSERVDKYCAAITRTVKPGDVVMDLGAGTGILSFFAARNAERVYAVEQTSTIEVAQKLRAANHISNVHFFKGNSRDFVVPATVDVIVHEQIGSMNPFSENMLENLLDARDRLLKPGGKILPNRFEIYLEPVELKQSSRVPYLWELDLHSVRFASLRPGPEELPLRGRPIRPSQILHLHPSALNFCLCTPNPVLSFDLDTLELARLPKHIHYAGTTVRPGCIDGLYLYFKAFFQGENFIGTDPGSPANHWLRTLYRSEKIPVEAGTTVEYDLKIGSFVDDSTWAITWLKPEPR